MYVSTINENFNIILDPKNLFLKNKNINKLIFKIAYYHIKKQKFNFVFNLCIYLFYLSCRNTKNFQKLNLKQIVHLNPSVINKLRENQKIYFDYEEPSKDDFINQFIKKKYIIFHCRDSAYKKKVNNYDYSYHDYRDCKLDNYEKALSKFNNLESFVRFGSIAEERCKSDNIFDYTFSKYRNEKNDLILMKNCDLFVGTGSGPDILAQNFNKPIVYTDWLHLPLLFTYKENVIVIFKKIYNKKENTFLKVKDLLNLKYKIGSEETPVGLYNKTQQYSENNLEIIDNTPDEIFNAINEMINLLNGKLKINDELQNLFKHVYKKQINLPISKNFYVSEYFIKNNLNLFS